MNETTSPAGKAENVSTAAFARFLKWLDDGSESDGESYLVMRKRLLTYFDRKNCRNSDELADDTLTRVARRLDEEGEINAAAPAQYCYTVARFVFLEHLRNKESSNLSFDDPSASRVSHEIVASEPDLDSELKEKLLTCLDKCTSELRDDDRKMIIGYYRGKERIKIENRRSIASKLGISMNALSIRVCRLRDKLESCVKKCAG